MFLKKIHNFNVLKYPALALTLTAASLLWGYVWAAEESKPAVVSTPAPAGKLNDTGITWGGDYPKDINTDCSAEFNPQQLKQFQELKQLPADDPVQGDI